MEYKEGGVDAALEPVKEKRLEGYRESCGIALLALKFADGMPI